MPRKKKAFPKKQRGGQRLYEPQTLRKIVALRGADPKLKWRRKAVKQVIPAPRSQNTHRRVSEEVKKYEEHVVDCLPAAAFYELFDHLVGVAIGTACERPEQRGDVVLVKNRHIALIAAQLEHYDPVCHQNAPPGTLVLATQGTPEREHACKHGYYPWRQGRDELGDEWVMRKDTGRLLTPEEHEAQCAKYFAEIGPIFLDGWFPGDEEEPNGSGPNSSEAQPLQEWEII